MTTLYFLPDFNWQFNSFYLPTFVFTSRMIGIGIFEILNGNITSCFGSFFTYLIALTLVKTPLKPTSQNQLKSSPATFSIVLKKSSGVGCLKAQRST
jgi:hypothetical protein